MITIDEMFMIMFIVLSLQVIHRLKSSIYHGQKLPS